jgi:bifunctional DNA-binding transcriptional regulator/antitoxin component of YhaV-PrlF toxin-antitoxin module
MALARVKSNGMIELPDDVVAEFGIHEGDEFRVERIEGNLTLVPADPVRAAREAIAQAHTFVRSGKRVDPATLPPTTAAEEEAIARYERATERFRTPESE